MKSQPAPRMNCPLDAAMSMIEGKWKTVILCRMMIEGRPLRFKELMEVEGISARILTKQLREMEGDELVSRKVYPVVPPKTEYTLTDLGKSLVPIVKAMDKWGEAWFKRMGLPVPCDEE